jgi:hypothetical protein
MPIVHAIGFYLFVVGLYACFGFPQVPHRDSNLMGLDALINRGLLLPAFIFLLFLVGEIVAKSIDLVEQCFPDGKKGAEWPYSTLSGQANPFGIAAIDMKEWVGVRFMMNLSKRIYGIIGYPLLIALLMVLARSNYFDNWTLSVALKLVITSSIGLLIYWDYQLKRAVDKAKNNALNLLRQKAMKYKFDAGHRGDKINQLITFIEQDADSTYKALNQRPIFINCLLILLAILADYAIDYTQLVNKLL